MYQAPQLKHKTNNRVLWPQQQLLADVDTMPIVISLLPRCHALICSVQALPDDQQQQRAAPLAAAVTSLAWSRSGRQLLSGSLDKRVMLWDVLTGELVRAAAVM